MASGCIRELKWCNGWRCNECSVQRKRALEAPAQYVMGRKERTTTPRTENAVKDVLRLLTRLGSVGRVRLYGYDRFICERAAKVLRRKHKLDAQVFDSGDSGFSIVVFLNTTTDQPTSRGT